ncbi:MAG: hypothetical protein JXN59_18635 [Anaerolineae bacterium]|nr:hypothetical protein [Anaerolineae bacterium]
MPQTQQSSSAARQALTSLIKVLTQLDVAGWLTTLKDILQAIIPAKPKLEDEIRAWVEELRAKKAADGGKESDNS